MNLFLRFLLAMSIDFLLLVFSLNRLFADQLSSCVGWWFRLDLNASMLDMRAEELIELSSANISVIFCPITPAGRSLMKTRKKRGTSIEL